MEGSAPVEEDDDDANTIDDEETGGEWITEENLHKHLSHGVVLPIVPTETEIGVIPAIIPDGAAPEETKEDDNSDFPAFDEAKLPSMADLEQR